MSGGGGGKAIGYLIENAKSSHGTLMVNSTPIVIRSLVGRFPHNFRDLTLVSGTIGDYAAFVVGKDSPLNSMDDLLAAFDADPSATAIEHVGVDHRGADVGVTQQFLDGPDVVAALQQVGGERVPNRVRRRPLVDRRGLEAGCQQRPQPVRGEALAGGGEEKRRGPRYTPLSKRQDRPNAILWLVKFHPELSDGQVSKLVGTTKPTIQAIRERTHWNISNNMLPANT